jgi:hypothetical protein
VAPAGGTGFPVEFDDISVALILPIERMKVVGPDRRGDALDPGSQCGGERKPGTKASDVTVRAGMSVATVSRSLPNSAPSSDRRPA